MKRQTQTDKLQKYLDEQIQAFSHPEKPSFDHIETKLRKIEQKLIGLKSQSQQQIKYNYGQQMSEVNIGSSSVKSKEDELSPAKKEPAVFAKQIRNMGVWTPAKQLDIVPKTMSAVHLGASSQKETAKKTKKKCSTTAKKKDLKVQSLANLFQAKDNRYKSTPQKSTGRQVNHTVKDSERKVKILQKEIQQHEKSNADLRRRMNQLKGFQTECHKLKQIFDRCEQLRRHTRLHRHKI